MLELPGAHLVSDARLQQSRPSESVAEAYQRQSRSGKEVCPEAATAPGTLRRPRPWATFGIVGRGMRADGHRHGAGGLTGATRLSVKRHEWNVFVLLVLASACRAHPPGGPVDLLLVGGRVLDGAGNPWARQDVGVTGDRITFVGQSGPARITARDTLDVSGFLLAPGFWDVHSHADLGEPHGRTALPLLYQGVTTVVLGVDGFGGNALSETFAGYGRAGIAVNALHLVGHNAARAAAMGAEFGRPATPDEIERMKAYVARGMDEGAVGLSSGLAYNPGFYATTDEVVELARVAAGYGGVYDTHDRDLGATFRGFGYLASIREAIEIAERAGLPLIFSHFNALGRRSHGLVPEGIALVEAARARGVDVMAGQHVYTASQSSLVAHALPRWVGVGGPDSLVRRLNDPSLADRLDAEILEVLELRGGPEKLVLTDAPRDLDGRSVAELARSWGLSVPAAVRRIVREGGPSVSDLNLDIYSMDNIRELAAKDWMMTCTDGTTPVSREGSAHPRSYGNFTRKLRVLVQEEGVITLPFAVRGMTSLAAGFFGIPDRGLVKPGFFADLVVLDETSLRDRATYDDPHQYSSGAVHVLVNGRFALRDGEPTGLLAGQPIRRSGQRAGEQ